MATTHSACSHVATLGGPFSARSLLDGVSCSLVHLQVPKVLVPVKHPLGNFSAIIVKAWVILTF